MIKYWTWEPLEVGCHYAKTIDEAFEQIQKYIDKYEAWKNDAILKENAKRQEINSRLMSEILHHPMLPLYHLSDREIQDMFVVFDTSINSMLSKRRIKKYETAA